VWLVYMHHVTENSSAKTGECPFPNFQNRVRCEKYLKDYKHNSLHLVQKILRSDIFVFAHNLFLKAHSFPWATTCTLSENCSLLETVLSTDKCPSIFPHQMEAIVDICIFPGLLFEMISTAIWRHWP